MAKDPKRDDRKDVQRVEIVPPASQGTATTAAPALTPGQRAGLEPIDPQRDAEQAADREHLTNLQTDHEAENVLDPVSGTPTPGIVTGTPLTGVAQGQLPSDESGRPPMALNDDLKALLPQVRERLTAAKKDDKNRGRNDKEQGYRNALELGLSGAQMRKIAEAYPERFESVTIPQGHFFPDTGTRYRLK